MTVALTRYDAARQALAECVRIDEAKEIVDKTVALAAYARQAEDRELEANAVELRERATRRLGELLAETDLAKGGRPKTGSNSEPVSDAPKPVKLRDLGVSKKLSSEAQRKAAIPKAEFETRLERMHARVAEGKAPDIAFREQDREKQRVVAREVARGISEASALKPTGRLFPVVYADPAWKRKAGFGDRAYENHYGTMSWDDIIAMPVKDRLLPNAWVFLWIPRAHLLALHPVEIDTPLGRTTVKMPLAWAVAQAWGCDAYSTCFIWTKTDEEQPEDHGMGLIAWDQDEILCLFKRGRGLPMPSGAEKFGSNHRERAGRHSEKPAFYRDMINTMTGSLPVLELFAREDDDHVLPPNFFTWGAGSKNSADLPAHDPSTGEIIEPENGNPPSAGATDVASSAPKPAVEDSRPNSRGSANSEGGSHEVDKATDPCMSRAEDVEGLNAPDEASSGPDSERGLQSSPASAGERAPAGSHDDPPLDHGLEVRTKERQARSQAAPADFPDIPEFLKRATA